MQPITVHSRCLMVLLGLTVTACNGGFASNQSDKAAPASSLVAVAKLAGISASPVQAACSGSVIHKNNLPLLGAYSTLNLLSVDFNGDQLGLYSKDDFKKDWNMNPNQSSGQGSRLAIVTDGDSEHKVLELTYLAGQIGGNSAMTFTPTIGIPGSNQYTHLYFQYKVKFASNFTWVKGGKLPGLTSGPDSPTGCIDNGTFDGFSARRMWRESGEVFSYIYDPVKAERCGDYYTFSPLIYFNSGQWYTLTQEVKLNDIGKSNAYIREWVDGSEVLNLQGMLLRNSADIFIDQIKMDSFFGGSTSDWAPATNQYAYFDAFVVSETSPLSAN